MKDKREALIQELNNKWGFFDDMGGSSICCDGRNLADFIIAHERSMREEIEELKSYKEKHDKPNLKLAFCGLSFGKTNRQALQVASMLLTYPALKGVEIVVTTDENNENASLKATMGKVRKVLHDYKVGDSCGRIQDALALLNETTTKKEK